MERKIYRKLVSEMGGCTDKFGHVVCRLAELVTGKNMNAFVAVGSTSPRKL